MESSFCSNCGAKISEGASFCGACGEKVPLIKTTKNVCFNCGCSVKADDKFCPECGTHIIDKISSTMDSRVLAKNIRTSESEEVITSKNNQSKNRKKRSFIGCLGKSLLVIISILIIGIVIIWNLPEEDNETTIDTSIPGIVDIEDDKDSKDVRDNENSSISKDSNLHEETNNRQVIESNDLSQIVKSVEDVFKNADTIGLKKVLSSTSLKMYKGSFSEIQPYMNGYSKAFKNRKLVHSSKIYALYSFIDEEGNEYTAEFSNDGSGTWKLIHF